MKYADYATALQVLCKRCEQGLGEKGCVFQNWSGELCPSFNILLDAIRKASEVEDEPEK